MSSSYYFQKEEESREDGAEIRRTVHHVVEEIIVEEEEEYGEDWSVPSSPAPPRPPPAMPMAMPMPSPASLASSQSAHIGMGSEQEEAGGGDEPNGAAKWGQITVDFPILVGTTPEATATNSPPPTSRPILPSPNNANYSNFTRNLGNNNTMAAQPVQGKMPKGWSPKMGRGQRIAPESAKRAHPSDNCRRKSMTAPQRALFLFCATLLFLLFSTILVLLILFWFNPTLR